MHAALAENRLLRSELAVLEFTAFAEGSRSSCATEVREFFVLADEQDQRGPREDKKLAQVIIHCSPDERGGAGKPNSAQSVGHLVPTLPTPGCAQH